MSYVSRKGYKLFAKSSNYSTVAQLSSTLDDTYLLFVANNCNNYFYDDKNNAGIIGATSSNLVNGGYMYETYIASKEDDVVNKIATFNKDYISLQGQINVSGDIIPSINEIYNLGSSQYKWKDLYLAGNTLHLGNTTFSNDSITNSVSIKTQNDNYAPLFIKSVSFPTDNADRFIKIEVNTDNKFSFIEIDSDNNVINEVNVQNLNTNTLIEGSNLFFTWNRAGMVSFSSNQETSNYVLYHVENTSNTIMEDINDLALAVSTNFINLNADNIADGTTNRFIKNNIYDTNLTVVGTLTTSNLNVVGESTIVNTTTYEAEKLHIVHDEYDGAAIRIDHYGTLSDEVFSAWNFFEVTPEQYSSNSIIMINKNGNVGFSKPDPEYTIDVNGTIRCENFNVLKSFNASSNLNVTHDVYANYFRGLGTYLTQVNLNDRNSDMLTQGTGSNFYYTSLEKESMSNYIQMSVSNIWSNLNTFLDIDNFSQGETNKFIINNVYDNDLYVAGKLMVTGIEIVDLDYILSQDNTAQSFGNFYDYIALITSNIVKDDIVITSNQLISYIDQSVTDTSFWKHVEETTNTNITGLVIDTSELPFKHSTGTGTNLYRVYDISLTSIPEPSVIDDTSAVVYSGVMTIVYNNLKQIITNGISMHTLYGYFDLSFLDIDNDLHTVSYTNDTPSTIFSITIGETNDELTLFMDTYHKLSIIAR